MPTTRRPASRRKHAAVRQAIAVCAVAASAACSGNAAEPTVGPEPSIREIADVLGCTSVRGTQYDTGLWIGLETEKGRDCYRDEEFFARIHVLVDGVRPEAALLAVQPSGSGSPQPLCHHIEMSIAAGDHWIVVSRGSNAAEEVLELTGGRSIDAEGATTFTSYFLPCAGDPEPP